MYDLPAELGALHQGEEEVRKLAINSIGESLVMKDHGQATRDALNHIDRLLQLDSSPSTTLHTTQLLAIRSFNSASVSWKLGLSGYYQAAFASLRDLLELLNLVDLFRLQPELIEIWRIADKKTEGQFKPVKVREALARHPVNAGQDRAKKYAQFSVHASHANYKGFTLLAPEGTVRIGPFFDAKMLKAFLEEIGTLSSHLALALSLLVKSDDLALLAAKADFLERLRSYHDKYIKEAPSASSALKNS